MVGRRHARAVGESAYRRLWPEELHGGILLCCQFRRTFHALARRTLAQDSIARDECRPEGCRVLPLACSKRRSAVNQRPRFLLCPRRAVATSHERSALLQSHGGRSRPKRHGDQGQQHRCGRARARDARPPFPGRAIGSNMRTIRFTIFNFSRSPLLSISRISHAAKATWGGRACGEAGGTGSRALVVAFTLLRRTYTGVGRGALPGGARGANGADGDAARPERVSTRAPSGRGALPKVQLNVPRRCHRSNSGPGSGEESSGPSSPRPVGALPKVAGVRSRGVPWPE